MKILVRRHERGSDNRLAMHCERLLMRILGEYSPEIDAIDVYMEPYTEMDGQMKYRCMLTARLLSGGSVQACVADCEEILGVYRAAEKMKFCIAHRAKPRGCKKAKRRGVE